MEGFSRYIFLGLIYMLICICYFWFFSLYLPKEKETSSIVSTTIPKDSEEEVKNNYYIYH